MSESGKSFTGRKRRRETRSSVIWADRIAATMITMGGIGTIIAVSAVCVFLVSVVIPLFESPSLKSEGEFEVSAKPVSAAPAGTDDSQTKAPASSEAEEGEAPAARSGNPQAKSAEKIIPGDPRHFMVDEHLTMGWAFFEDGSIKTFSLVDGSELQTLRPFGENAPTCWSFSIKAQQCAFGFSDGTVRLGEIGFEAEFLEKEHVPSKYHNMEVGAAASYEDGMLELTPEKQFRVKRLKFSLEDPVSVSEKPILLIDQSFRTTGPVFAALTEDGALSINSVRKTTNLLTRKTTLTLSGGKTDISWTDKQGPPKYLLINGLGNNVFAIWEDGKLTRFDARDGDPKIAEELDVVEKDGDTVTSAAFLNGKSSLIVGDSAGNVDVWFRIKPEGLDTLDGSTLVSAVDLSPGAAAVTSLAASPRSRMLAAGFADGTGRLYYVTSRRLLTEFDVADGPVSGVLVAPKEDAVLASAGSHLQRWTFDAKHADITLAAIFTPVWYEGNNEPEHVWQSSSATDDYEPKYGLYPLIFGTIKATVYSMLFAVPLALLAAIYTSEFLHPRVKSRVKPVVEMMASLPSVVLGFLAGVVIAPLIEDVVPETLMMLVMVPAGFILAGYLWQLLPKSVAARLSNFRVWILLLVVPTVYFVAVPLARPMENLLYGGDIKAWLDGQVGTGIGGWVFLFLPICACTVALVTGRVVNPWLRRFAKGWSHQMFALLDLGKFFCAAGLTLAFTLGISWVLSQPGLLSSDGFDPRGSFVGTYIQRNAMIVGFIMGFAVIPIIYTIAEDALSAVPEHLRAASLGAGATPWQTAIRVILPTAMSGLFSAVMIGLGRAVGETMIVLMAAGNTAVLDWNIFNGFRTLSANIAVELPEAVRDSSHYRLLFLSALVLFAMTFVVNTIAEIVRLRFRKRAFEL